MTSRVSINVVEGDVLTFDADVLALKYAQEFYGVDEVVSNVLVEQGIDRATLRPEPGEVLSVPSGEAIRAKRILIVGVISLYDFGYSQIRDFARTVISSLASAHGKIGHIAVTLHGAGYGLDEIEAFESEIAGFLDAIRSMDVPRSLEAISVVERNPGRAQRLQGILDNLLPDGEMSGMDRGGFAHVGYASDAKPHIFVAMPFKDEMSDVYHYGIQGAVRAAGFLCERADLAFFVGDVVQWVQRRIKSSSLLVADLSDANPNVYLEVGYAWGCGVPTVLVVRDTVDLQFDVRGQKCVVYKSIRHLEESLRNELQNLRRAGTV